MDKYIKLENLGKGANGDVILVKNLQDKKLYAMKKIFMDKEEIEKTKILNEISILQTLEHPNVVRYIESFIYNKKMCIVMEYADKGDLSEQIKKHKNSNSHFEEEIIWNYFFQLAEALKYIHSKKIIHRDIKCQNIFMTKIGIIKLGDFGISKTLEHTFDFAKSFLGTPYFLSPEICKGSMYNYKSDIWMLGCVLYEISTLKKPFSGETFHALMQNIINKYHDPIPEIYSKELKELIDTFLTKIPENRPMINDLLINNTFLIEKYNIFLETKKRFEQICKNENDQKIIKMGNQPPSRNKEEKIIPNGNYTYFSNYIEKSPFNMKEMKVTISKGYESTPVKKVKDNNINNTANSTNDSYSKISNIYLSNSEALKSRIKSRKASMGFINQSQVQNNVTESEFFDSEKQIKKNLIRKKSDSQKNPISSENSLGKVPIKIIKQKIPPHFEANKDYVIFFGNKNNKNNSYSSNDFVQFESNTENVSSNNNVFNSKNSTIKLMFNFLKEKIGENLSDQLLNLINFSSDETIKKSLSENDEKIKTILGSYYKQVVNLIMHIVKYSKKNQPVSLKTNNEESNSFEAELEIIRSHKKHNSLGSTNSSLSKNY